MYNRIAIANTTIWYIGKLLREKILRALISFLYLHEMTDVNLTFYCGNHFTNLGYLIMLYTLNLHSAECQRHLNKTWGEMAIRMS